MYDAIGFLLFVVFGAFVTGGAVLLARRQAQRARANLAAVASELGLQLVEKPPVLGFLRQTPTVSGPHRGRAIAFHTYTTGSGKQRQTWQALAVSCDNPHGLFLQLGTQNFLSVIAEKLGSQDVKVGEPTFDERFVLKTNDAEFLRAALLPEIRQGLLAGWSARASGAHVKLAGGQLLYAELGSFTDPAGVARMRTLLEPLLALAALPEVYRK